MARLFVALVPPAEVVDPLAGVVAEVRPRYPDLAWSAAERWHVTLAFLGEVADDRRPGLDERLARVARRHGPVVTRLGSAGRFGQRVLICRIAGPLVPLVHGVRRAAERAGVDGIDDRPPSPHLTLARVRTSRPVDLRPVVEALRGPVEGLETPGWTADRITLVRSRLGPAGGYTEEASWLLAGKAAT